MKAIKTLAISIGLSTVLAGCAIMPQPRDEYTMIRGVHGDTTTVYIKPIDTKLVDKSGNVYNNSIEEKVIVYVSNEGYTQYSTVKIDGSINVLRITRFNSVKDEYQDLDFEDKIRNPQVFAKADSVVSDIRAILGHYLSKANQENRTLR